VRYGIEPDLIEECEQKSLPTSKLLTYLPHDVALVRGLSARHKNDSLTHDSVTDIV